MYCIKLYFKIQKNVLLYCNIYTYGNSTLFLSINKGKGLLEVRLQHLQLIWTAKSKIEVTGDFWNNQRKRNSRNIDVRNEQVRVEK